MDYPLVMGVTVLFGGRVYRRPTVVLLEAFVKEGEYMFLYYQEKLSLFFHKELVLIK